MVAFARFAAIGPPDEPLDEVRVMMHLDHPSSWLNSTPMPTALSPVVEIMARGHDGLLISLSDLPIGGDPGQEDFFCQREFIALLDDLDREEEPVTLLINGDFFEFLQVT